MRSHAYSQQRSKRGLDNGDLRAHGSGELELRGPRGIRLARRPPSSRQISIAILLSFFVLGHLLSRVIVRLLD